MANTWLDEIYMRNKDEFYYKAFTLIPPIMMPEIKDVIFNNPATIVKWGDSTKTIVQLDKRYDTEYNPEHGLAMAICKKALGNKGNFNDVFRKWVWENPRLENKNE